MNDLISLEFVFTNVFIEQIGFPLPSTPVLILAGAAVYQGQIEAQFLFPIVFIATLIPNLIWFMAGRRYGHKIMGMICKMTLTPESCVTQTTSAFSRWGVLSLLVAKFIPGFSTLAAPLAGATNVSLFHFLIFNSLGSLIWLMSSICVGYLFHNTVNQILSVMKDIGAIAIPVVVLALVAYAAYKWWRRKQFLSTIKMERITVDELKKIQTSGAIHTIYEIRNQTQSSGDLIPGARVLSLSDIEEGKNLVGFDHEIITYCHCPEEASAAVAANKLKLKGYTRVRPLKGGADAWFEN